MPLVAKNTAVGVIPVQAVAAIGTVTSPLTADGTDQSTALLLSYDDVQLFATVAAGTGCIFQATGYAPGDSVSFFNQGANALSIYPASGGKINNGTTNAALSLAVNTGLTLVLASGLNWVQV